MRPHYDFSKAKRNPYAKRLKQQITIRLDKPTFEEASTAFGDPLSITVHDPGHSEDETRFVLVGLTFEGKLVVVVHVELEDSIEIISAREATPRERIDYEQG